MPYFNNDGIKIYYEIEGEGPPVIMIHGFTSSIEGNWRQTNWVKKLKDNYRLILLDCRGHGKSDKPHDASYYGQKMTEDIVKLLEFLSIEKANFIGYSMGAYMTFRLLLSRSDLFISATLGGFVLNLKQDEKETSDYIGGPMMKALQAESLAEIKDPMVRGFRQFLESSGSDLKTLAAVLKGLQEGSETMVFTPQIKETLQKINTPVLTVVGSNELIQGDKTLIAQLVPGACHFQIQGKDHLTVVPDRKFKMVVKAFLDFVNNA